MAAAVIALREETTWGGRKLRQRLQTLGQADETADVATAVSMFMSSMFGDAISRDVLPHAFPQPEEDAPAKYVNVFLRAVGAAGGPRG